MFYSSHSPKCVKLNSIGQQTWKSYASLKKKAMEQEFTWSGFLLSLSIAFVVVGTTSSCLNAVYENIELGANNISSINDKVYIIEAVKTSDPSTTINC